MSLNQPSVATVEREGEAVTVTPLGSYAAAYETGLLKELSELLDRLVEQEGCRELRLDLAHLNFTCASFRALLIGLHKKLAQRGGRLVAVNLSPTIYQQFDRLRLTKLIDLRQADSSE